MEPAPPRTTPGAVCHTPLTESHSKHFKAAAETVNDHTVKIEVEAPRIGDVVKVITLTFFTAHGISALRHIR